MRKAILGALAFSVFTAAQASAVTIDFTSSVWDPGNNNDIKTVGNTTVEAFGPGNERLTWGSDGFGVNSEGNDNNQIEENERVEVRFSNLAFQVTSFSVTRLGDSEDGYYRYYTTGNVWSNWTKFDGTQNGNRTVTLNNPVWVTALQFGYNPQFETDDHFYLKNLVGDWQQPQTPTAPAVPEPTTMMLLGTGLVGLVARARRLRV